jgi:hypothetical protein
VCDFEVIGVPSRLRFTRKTVGLTRVLSTVDLNCEENTINSLCDLPDLVRTTGLSTEVG